MMAIGSKWQKRKNSREARKRWRNATRIICVRNDPKICLVQIGEPEFLYTKTTTAKVRKRSKLSRINSSYFPPLDPISTLSFIASNACAVPDLACYIPAFSYAEARAAASSPLGSVDAWVGGAETAGTCIQIQDVSETNDSY